MTDIPLVETTVLPEAQPKSVFLEATEIIHRHFHDDYLLKYRQLVWARKHREVSIENLSSMYEIIIDTYEAELHKTEIIMTNLGMAIPNDTEPTGEPQ